MFNISIFVYMLIKAFLIIELFLNAVSLFCFMRFQFYSIFFIFNACFKNCNHFFNTVHFFMITFSFLKKNLLFFRIHTVNIVTINKQK